MQNAVAQVQPVFDRMNYTGTGIIARWQDRFPTQQPPKPKKVTPPPKRPPAVTPQAAKPAAKSPATETTAVAKPKTAKGKNTAVALIQKTPTVSEISRLENRDDYEKAVFVAKAVSKDENRNYLRVIHIEELENGSRLVATDGVRLHTAEIAAKIKGGDYKPLVNKDMVGFAGLDDEVTFPNWMRVIPEKPPMLGTISLENAGIGKDIAQTEQMSNALTAIIKQTGKSVNLRFLEDLPKRQWRVYSESGESRPLMLKENGHEESVYAVMMPLPPVKVDTMAKAA
jgi:hypothetical protein